MRQPKNGQELGKGRVTYYSKFIPNVPTVTNPLRKPFFNNQKFCWSKKYENVFIKLKKEISGDRILVSFNSKLPVKLTTVASPVGIEAVLSHVINNVEKPIAFASCSLTEAERNYSQLNVETLAITFVVSIFFNCFYGRHFVLITDNHPL